MDDSSIVDLFLARNEIAITECRNKYGNGIRKVIYKILEDVQFTEECENDTYLQAWHIIPPHEPRSYLFPFLGRIAKHKALDEMRKQGAGKRSATVVELSEELSNIAGSMEHNGENSVLAKELAGLISCYLKELPKETRVIFVRRYWYMDSVKDITTQMGVSESKVKTSLYRTREGLKEFLRKEGYGL